MGLDITKYPFITQRGILRYYLIGYELFKEEYQVGVEKTTKRIQAQIQFDTISNLIGQ